MELLPSWVLTRPKKMNLTTRRQIEARPTKLKQSEW
jgi:hypothetical protein